MISRGPRRTDSLRRRAITTRILGGLSLLLLLGAIVWDLLDDAFWAHHALLTNLVASGIVVAVTLALLNEVRERRQRQRWAVLAQYALFEFVSAARLVWSSLLEITQLMPDGNGSIEFLKAGSDAVHDTQRLSGAMDEVLGSADRRQLLHRLMMRLLGHGQEVLGRWAAVMVNSGSYAETVDRHVELYSRLYWWGSVLDESEPLDDQLRRPKLSRVSPATQNAGPVEDAWLCENLVAIAQLAESLDRASFAEAFRIVPRSWWATQLPNHPSSADNVPS